MKIKCFIVMICLACNTSTDDQAKGSELSNCEGR